MADINAVHHDEAPQGHGRHSAARRGDRLEFHLLLWCTYPLFLLISVITRAFPSRYASRHDIPRPSIFREAWDTASAALAFAFNPR